VIVMMKRGRVVSDMSMIQRGAGAARVVPPGPCWVLEGSHWVALIWHEAQERQRAELTHRDYTALVEQGWIQFPASGDEDSSPAPLYPERRRELHTPTSALSTRFV
jgi:hypothetical protein